MIKDFSQQENTKDKKSRVHVINNIITKSSSKNIQQAMWEEMQNLCLRVQELEKEVATLKNLLNNEKNNQQQFPQSIEEWAIKETASAIYAVKKIKNKQRRVYICKNRSTFSTSLVKQKIQNYLVKHKL